MTKDLDVLHVVKGKKHTAYFGFNPGFEDGGGMLIQPPVEISETALEYTTESGAYLQKLASSTFGTMFRFEIGAPSPPSPAEALECARTAARMLLEQADNTADIETFKNYFGIEKE